MKTHYLLRSFIISVLFVPVLASAVTIDELRAQLESLLAQTVMLQQAQVSAALATTTNVSCPTLSRSLGRGTSGTDVMSLQNFLIAQQLLSSDSATGYFGPLTEVAVQKFQAQSSVVTSGNPNTTGYGLVGGQTRAAITARCGANVLGVQSCPKYPIPVCKAGQGLQEGSMGWNGCRGASICVNVTTTGTLTASPVSGTAPLNVTFIASSNSKISGGLKINPGDGSAEKVVVLAGATSGTLLHAYAKAGTYTAQLLSAGDWANATTILSTKTITVSVPPAPIPPQEGQILASSFKNKADIAVELQAAINNPATKVIVFDGTSSTVYVSSGVRLRSDLKIIIGNNVTLRAKAQAFTKDHDMFIRGDYSKNVTIEGGPGSRIVLNKPEYTFHVHALGFYNAENIIVRNLRISDSGGDGLYFGDHSGGKGYNKNILIDSVFLDNHARNALSVTTVDGLIVRNSTFANTKADKSALGGPWAGIDLEPDYPGQIMKNVEIRDSVFYGNAGVAIDLHFTKITDPANNVVSVKMIRNRIYNSEWGIKLVYIFDKPFTGKIEVNGLCSDRPTMVRAVYGPTYAPTGTFTTSDVRLKCTSF